MSDNTADLTTLSRRCWAALETIHITGYFEVEPREAYRALGLRSRHAYFAARSAPMGAVTAGVTTATFAVFAPRLVQAAIPGCWEVATPRQVLQARYEGMTAALHRLVPLDPAAGDVREEDVREAARLARRACNGLTAMGRPLYAGHAALPWPEDPLLALWHAATLLREHRGDGHVSLLVHSGLDPVEALVTGGLQSGATAFYRAARGWTDEEWADAEARLRERGLIDDSGLTASGHALREDLERRTDWAAQQGWAHLGVADCQRLLDIVTPIRAAVVAGAAFPAGFNADKE